MALKLKTRELPTVSFRRVLPDYLGPDGEECFIEFNARAGGRINPAFVEMSEKALMNLRVAQRKLHKITDDEEFVKADKDASSKAGRQSFAVLYDTCVIDWTSNIQTEDEDGKVSAITCDRATFLALTDEPIPELADAIVDFQAKVKEAGEAVTKDDDDTVKN